jgi:hypothetical protein
MKIIKHLRFERKGDVREIRVIEETNNKRYVNVIIDYDYNEPLVISFDMYDIICDMLIRHGYKLMFAFCGDCYERLKGGEK